MTIETLQYISVGAYVAAGIFLLAAIVVFFVLKIPAVIGDLTGRTAKRAIDNIRYRNETTGEKAYKPSKVNVSRGKLTEKMNIDGSKQKRKDISSPGFMTQKISNAAPENDETTVLTESNENETTVLGNSENETTVLGGSETTVLNKNYNGNDTLPKIGVTAELVGERRNTAAAVKNNSMDGVDGSVTVIAELMFAQSTEIVK